MKRSRLEAFSDGVIAIIITIMVLEIKTPEGGGFSSLEPVIPHFLSYVLSFLYIGIYWNNHHHMLQAAEVINGKVLWANLHLLFWLSLVPFVSSWMGENSFTPVAMFTYGFVLLMAAIAYYILQHFLAAENKALSQAIGRDFKGKTSIALYAIAMGIAFWNTWISGAIYLLVALMWFIPDKRVEKIIK